jgi:hypothetical protein
MVAVIWMLANLRWPGSGVAPLGTSRKTGDAVEKALVTAVATLGRP